MIIESLSVDYQKRIAELVNRIRDGECCVFIGAGLSIPAGYPSWTDLLKNIKKEVERTLGETINDDYLDNYDKAEIYREKLGEDAYFKIICDEFNPDNNKQPCLPAHRYIVAMPFVSYISTNYDCTIENAFSDNGEEPVYNHYPTLPVSKLRARQIYHIHGIIDYSRLNETRKSVILTRSDFDEAYKPESTLMNLFTSMYTELTILFVGFNFNDDFMKRILYSRLLEYERTKKVATEREIVNLRNIKHYAFLPYTRTEKDPDFGSNVNMDNIDYELSNQIDAELNSLGVYAIRYIDDARNHTRLIYLLREMSTLITGTFSPPLKPDLTFVETNP